MVNNVVAEAAQGHDYIALDVLVGHKRERHQPTSSV